MPKLEPMQQPPARGSGRRARVMRVSTSLAEINVVPLVDVMLVLLVIFMVAAPLMKQGFPVQLPQSKQSMALKSAPVTVTVPNSFRRDQRVRIDDETVPHHDAVRAIAPGVVGPHHEGRGPGQRRRRHDAGDDDRLRSSARSRREQHRIPDAAAHRTAAMTATMSFPGHVDDGFRRMVRISVGIHVVLLAVYIFFPRGWFERERPVLMTISLGSGMGERTSGTTAIGAREVEKATPPPKRPEPVKPTPPEKADVMKVPAKTVPTPEKKAAEAKVTPPPATKPPATGAEVQKGSTAVETGARGQSTGITVGGGGGATTVIPADFCCPDYVREFIALINENWNRSASQPGETMITFTIYKDGTMSDPVVTKSSGITLTRHPVEECRSIHEQAAAPPGGVSQRPV